MPRRPAAPVCPRNGGHRIRLLGPIERVTGPEVTYRVRYDCPACNVKNAVAPADPEWATSAPRPIIDV